MRSSPLLVSPNDGGIIYVLNTLNGKPVTNMYDFDAVSDWLRENNIHQWQRGFSKISPITSRSKTLSDTFIIYFSFVHKEDAALFKLFWSEDISDG